MGWPLFFRVLSGAAIVVLIWLILATNRGMDLDEFAAHGLVPPRIVLFGADAFAGLVVLAFLVFWGKSFLSWPLKWSWGLLRWLFRWRMIRRYLYGLAGLALLLALLYAEEDWRGKRNWERYKRAAEAKGERFDVSSFVPPAVPDDRNFACAPIVSNSCLHLAVWNGQWLEDTNTNAQPRLDVRINARYDWKPWPTNDFQGNWQCGKRIDLRVFQAYYRAPVNTNWHPPLQWGMRPSRLGSISQGSFSNTIPEQVATNEFPVAPQPQTPVADVLLALSKYDSAIEELRQASRRPFIRFPLYHDRESTNRTPLLEANLDPLQECVSVLRLRAVAELENGQSEKALEDVKLMLYLANAVHGEAWREPVSIPNLNSTLQPIWQGLVDHQWSDAQLVVIQEELSKFDILSNYQHFIRSQRADVIEKIDSVEQRRSHDFWAQFYFGTDQDGRSLIERVFSGDTLIDIMPKGWFDENDVAAARIFQASLRTEAEVERRILSSEVAKRYDEAMACINQHRSPCNFAAMSLCPAFSRHAENFAFAQSSLDRARVACALERHRLAEGVYPAGLEALTPRFMEKLPHDIINDQSLHYRRTDDGRFLLYSVGWNGTDDGGIIVREQDPAYAFRGRPARGVRPFTPNPIRRQDQRYAILDKDQGDWVWPNPEN